VGVAGLVTGVGVDTRTGAGEGERKEVTVAFPPPPPLPPILPARASAMLTLTPEMTNRDSTNDASNLLNGVFMVFLQMEWVG
ncbi:TPA: hypothetical protein DEG21_02625, partial [Patescibacteria group bacterium]|nr:hypothetical protein [Candidatus Gracilibacteria bacterium]HBY74770.1 hypothetical protein [Candidatus Gracilibacteria bacterium]